MTFISYAQNFEDIMLWRALKHVSKGFYIDVGAAWPDEHSVTNAFYQRGWTGINIEPNPELFGKFEIARVDDVNLCVAVGENDSVSRINLIGKTGLSTFDDSTAEIHARNGFEVERKSVAVMALRSICEKYVPANTEIHFLKIDVEGWEKAVLKGMDWVRFRPWIVVVEATIPLSQVEVHESWEAILLDAGYKFAYADGLNRFYVVDAREDLLERLRYPPNFFDDFRLSSHDDLSHRLAHLERAFEKQKIDYLALEKTWALCEEKLKISEKALQVRDDQLSDSKKRIAQIEGDFASACEGLIAIHNSLSWKITFPFRFSLEIIKKFDSLIKSAVRSLLLEIIRSILYRPTLFRILNPIVEFFPKIHERLHSMAIGSNLVDEKSTVFSANIEQQLDLRTHYLDKRAMRVLADLRSVLRK